MTSFVGPRTRTNSRYVLPAKLSGEFKQRNPPSSEDPNFAQGNAQLPYGRKEMAENALLRVGNGLVSRRNWTGRILSDRTHRRVGSAKPLGMSADVCRGPEVSGQAMIRIRVNV